jgi:DNA polymerase I-like protein with 3'-5' exonuclease and polymerase domains
VTFDVVVAAYLLDPERWEQHLNVERLQATALPVMVPELLQASLVDMAAVLQAAPEPGPGSIPSNKDSSGVLPQVWPAAAEAWATHCLKAELEQQYNGLEDSGLLLQLLQAVEVPLQEVLSDMEVTGICCEQDRLKLQKQELQVGASAGFIFALQPQQWDLRRQTGSRTLTSDVSIYFWTYIMDSSWWCYDIVM